MCRGPGPVEGNGEGREEDLVLKRAMLRGPSGGPRPVEGNRRSGQGGQDESCPGSLHL